MDLKDLVPSLETCKELKEAGFRQDTIFSYFPADDVVWVDDTIKVKDYALQLTNSEGDMKGRVAGPTLGEIEFPENIIIEYVKYSGYYIIKHTVDKKEIIKAFQSNSEIEARAALWLYLNNK